MLLVVMIMLWRMLPGNFLAAATLERLDIRVLSGEGVVHRPAQPATQRLLVEVVDQDANPVAGAMVTFQLPAREPGGTFLNGMKTDMVGTDASGRAWAGWMHVGRSTGEFDIEVTARKNGLRVTKLIHQEVRHPQAEDSGEQDDAGGVKITRRNSKDPAHRSASAPGKKWMWLAVLAGGAVGGLALGVAGGKGGRAAAPSPSGPSSPANAGPSVGAPQITVSKP